MTFKTIAAIFVVGTGAVLAFNAFISPIPGLEWARPQPVAGSGTEASTAASSTPGGGTGGRRANGGGSGTGAGAGAGPGGGRGGFDGPAPVTVATATQDDVPVYLRGVGTAKALATVTVRPQVDGRLMKVHFTEGQDVKRGDLLAEIDPVTYQAQLDQAVAKRKLTQVQLDNAESDLKRLTSVATGVVTQKSVDTQRAQVAQFEAQLKSDQAAIANAEAILGYTRIVSPLDGRTGQRLVDEGNLIRAGDAGIVTIAQVKPLSVQFTIPQQQLNDVQAALVRGPVPVEALAGDDQSAIDTGSLTFIDNQVDQATGTVKMKADLPNANLQLWPGQFANVRIRIDVLKNAVTVPTASVQRGPSGAFVYVVADSAVEGDASREAAGTGNGTGKARGLTAVARPVTITQQTERVAVIAQGLATGERVVTTGFGRLKDGAKIAISDAPELPGARGSQETPGDGARPAGPPAAGQTQPSAGANLAPSVGAPAGPAAVTDEAAARPEGRRRADGEGRRERPVVQ